MVLLGGCVAGCVCFLARATESWLGGFYCMSPVLVRSVFGVIRPDRRWVRFFHWLPLCVYSSAIYLTFLFLVTWLKALGASRKKIERFQARSVEFPVQWLGVKAKIEIPLSGTGFNVRQNTLRIEHLPESWPMDTESAWRERYCKNDFTFQDIVAHLQEECFTDDIFEGYENTKAFRWVAVFNEFWGARESGLC